MQVRRNVIHAGLGLFRRVQHIPGYASPLATSSPRHLRDTSRTSLLMSTSPSFSRHYVSTVPGLPTTPAAEQQQPEPPEPHEESHEAAQPMYEVTFTCRPCSHRSTHQMSKQGFHNGTVLITCPGCGNRHIMSDHLMVSYYYYRYGTSARLSGRYREVIALRLFEKWKWSSSSAAHRD